jgi:hypothetical protein
VVPNGSHVFAGRACSLLRKIDFCLTFGLFCSSGEVYRNATLSCVIANCPLYDTIALSYMRQICNPAPPPPPPGPNPTWTIKTKGTNSDTTHSTHPTTIFNPTYTTTLTTSLSPTQTVDRDELPIGQTFPSLAEPSRPTAFTGGSEPTPTNAAGTLLPTNFAITSTVITISSMGTALLTTTMIQTVNSNTSTVPSISSISSSSSSSSSCPRTCILPMIRGYLGLFILILLLI